MRRPERIRQQLLLAKGLSERLGTVAAGPALLQPKASDETELRVALRRDRLSGQLSRIERNDRIELERMAPFVRDMLTFGQSLATGRLRRVPEDRR